MKAKMCLALTGANFIYACVSIFTKLASAQVPLSLKYCVFVACAVGVLGVYAIVWQQILKRLPVSDAYMFKGLSLIFVLLISALVFGEGITAANIAGSAMIVGGIMLFAKS